MALESWGRRRRAWGETLGVRAERGGSTAWGSADGAARGPSWDSTPGRPSTAAAEDCLSV